MERSLPECLGLPCVHGTRRSLKNTRQTALGVHRVDKRFFAECFLSDTRQRLYRVLKPTLDKDFSKNIKKPPPPARGFPRRRHHLCKKKRGREMGGWDRAMAGRRRHSTLQPALGSPSRSRAGVALCRRQRHGGVRDAGRRPVARLRREQGNGRRCSTTYRWRQRGRTWWRC